MKGSHVAGLFLGCVAAALPAGGQRYELADGTLLEAETVALRGASLVHAVEVDEGTGTLERTYPLSAVARLHWPEPEALVEARRLLVDGERGACLTVLDSVRRQFAPFAKVDGSWWIAATRLRLRALDPAVAPAEVERTARELIAMAADPEAAGEARLALTELEIRAGRARLAQTMLDGILAEAVPAAVRARAWLLRGDIALAERRVEEAIESYLRIPVFHAAYAELLPASLEAAEKAFLAYGDDLQANRLAAERARRETEPAPEPSPRS